MKVALFVQVTDFFRDNRVTHNERFVFWGEKTAFYLLLSYSW